MSATLQSNAGEQKRILVAHCGDYSFGIDIMSLVDVIQRLKATPVPLSLPHIMGLVNLRGQIITEINVARSLQIKDSITTTGFDEGYSLIVNKGGQFYGFAFDSVGNVLDVNESDLKTIPETVSQTWRSLSRGIYKNGDQLIITLDLHYLIDHLTNLAEQEVAA